jgi:hypothetical protein
MEGERARSVLSDFFLIPLVVNELVLAIWLIVKGFNPTASIPNLPNRNKREKRSSL